MNTIKSHTAWNKGKLIGQKPPLKINEIWSIRVRLELSKQLRNLALFNLAIDSKLRGSDLTKLKVSDVSHGTIISNRAIIHQQKTKRPVQFEITELTRKSILNWIKEAKLTANDFLFKNSTHISTREFVTTMNNSAPVSCIATLILINLVICIYPSQSILP